MGLVRLRHVCRERRVGARHRVATVNGHPLALVEHLDRGPRRIIPLLNLNGKSVSASTVYSILKRHGLQTRALRLLKIEEQQKEQKPAPKKIRTRISEAVEKVMWDEKKLFANADFFTASVYHFMGIPTYLFTPIFVCSRITGWAAHIMEQRSNNKLIRPAANYIGPDLQQWVAIEDRT